MTGQQEGSATNETLSPHTIDSEDDEAPDNTSPKSSTKATHEAEVDPSSTRKHKVNKDKLAELMGTLGQASGIAMRKEIQRQIRTELGLRLRGPIPRNILKNDDGTVRDICDKLGLSIAAPKPPSRGNPAIPAKPSGTKREAESHAANPTHTVKTTRRTSPRETQTETLNVCEQCGQSYPPS